MNHPDQSTFNSTPALLQWALRVLCVLIAVSTLPWIWLAIGHFGGFAWGLFGFELITFMGALMTLLVTMGKVKVGNALPMAIACLIGTLMVGAVFGLFVDARAVVADDPIFMPWVYRTIYARFGAIAMLSLIAAFDVYRRDAKTWGLAVRGIVFMMPVLAALGWIKFKGIPATTDASGEPSLAGLMIILIAGLGLGILFSIAGHFLIRSFEVGFAEPEPTPKPEKSV
jgi:hypothetical protein